MRIKYKLIITSLMLIFASGISPAFAQQKDTLTVNKKGMVRLSSAVKAGDMLLKSGMYHVQHTHEGNDHVITFKPVSMPAGYRENQMNEGREILRLKCKVEPVSKKERNTKIRLSRNASGERVLEEIQIAGENVVHKF